MNLGAQASRRPHPFPPLPGGREGVWERGLGGEGAFAVAVASSSVFPPEATHP